MATGKMDPNRLRAQSKHLLYEIQMLSALAGYIREGTADYAVAHLPLEGVPVRNAVVEAFELHARNLIEFLIHQRSGDKSTAGDFTRGKWTRPGDWAPLKSLRSQFSERVAHLSWKRSAFTEKEQVVASLEIFAAIARNLDPFLEDADHELLCDGFIESARQALSWSIQLPPGTIPVASTVAPWSRPGGHAGGTATQALKPD